MKRILFIALLFLCLYSTAQTRLYFSSTVSAPITNVAYATGGGTYDVTEASRWKLQDTKGSSAIGTGTQIGPFAASAAVDRQYVSTRMSSGIIFTSGSTTVKGQLMVREFATTDNVDQWHINVRIVSDDGLTTRATFSGVTNSANEFINNATHRNQSVTAQALDASYTTVSGDRLVIDFAYRTSVGGTTPEAAGKWGENATDLPENSTQTTDGAGWVEFSNSITFIGEAAATPVPHNRLLMGAGNIAWARDAFNKFLKSIP